MLHLNFYFLSEFKNKINKCLKKIDQSFVNLKKIRVRVHSIIYKKRGTLWTCEYNGTTKRAEK